jgi:hypothetical protein
MEEKEDKQEVSRERYPTVDVKETDFSIRRERR